MTNANDANSLKNQLGGDENLVTDLIAHHSEKQINDAIKEQQDGLGNNPTDQDITDVDNHIRLLEKGLEKRQLNTSTTTKVKEPLKNTINKPSETNEHGYNFYDVSNLAPEELAVDVSEPRPILRDSSRGGGKMYDEITVSSKSKYPNSVLGEDIPNHVYIIDRGADTKESERFGVSDHINNVTVNAKTYDDALKVAKTFLSIRDKDPKAVLSINRGKERPVYDFSKNNASLRAIYRIRKNLQTHWWLCTF